MKSCRVNVVTDGGKMYSGKGEQAFDSNVMHYENSSLSLTVGGKEWLIK